ncbi:MAG: polymerase sigma-70 factor, subfamily [Actinomycetota bacterium]|nr:polymerase sigma-70 factor, subfamily [Actinomycetota bacterium]
MCQRRLGATGDAEGLAQEAFLRAWASFDRYSTTRPFWPWLATIARRLCADHVRRNHLERSHLAGELRVQCMWHGEPEWVIENQEEHRTAVRALRELRDRDQRLIGLADIDEWPIEKVAGFEGMTVEATRTALRRARISLRRSYERVLSGSPAVLALRRWGRLRFWLGQAFGRADAASSVALLSRGGEIVLAVLVATMGATAVLPPSPAGRRLEQGTDAVVPPGVPAGTTATAAASDPRLDRAAASSAGPEAPASGQLTPAVEGPTEGAWAFDRVSSPDDARITSFTASPAYEHDGTLYATGAATSGCTVYVCSVLFVSQDRGTSWSRLPATGFTGGRILLSPSYPADPRLFAAGASALQVSTDGGASFRPLTATGGEAAMSPAFATGDPRIVVGSTPRWTFVDGEVAARPTPTVPATAAPIGTGPLMLVGGTASDGSSPNTSAVLACGLDACVSRALLDGMSGTPSVRSFAVIDGRDELWAWLGGRLFRSTDDAFSFKAISVPSGATVRDVLAGKGETRYLAAASTDAGTGGVFRSLDGGDSWSLVRNLPVEAMAVLPDGRILAAAEGQGGIACSEDGGSTWQTRCA